MYTHAGAHVSIDLNPVNYSATHAYNGAFLIFTAIPITIEGHETALNGF
jgi:hypothetical protein